MIYLAAAELTAIFALVLLIGLREDRHAATILELIRAHDDERQVLLDRIERPGTVVAPAVQATVPAPDVPVDEYELLKRAYEGTTDN